jgi:RND family efflux transporter MFP subunit
MPRSVFFWILVATGVLVALLSWRRMDILQAGEAVQAVRSPLVVEVAPVRQDVIHKWVYGEGTARAARREYLSFRTTGRVVFIGSDAQGRELRAGSQVKGPEEGEVLGQMLAQLDRRESAEDVVMSQAQQTQAERRAESAEAALAQAEIELDLARKDFKRMQDLQAKGVIAGQQFEEARARLSRAESSLRSAQAELLAARSAILEAGARLRQTVVGMEQSAILAPFDGIITYMNIRRGDLFSPNLVDSSSEQKLLETVPMVLIDPNIFEVTIDLPAFDGILVREGQHAFIRLNQGLLPSDVWNAPPKDGAEQSALDAAITAYVYSVSPAISPGGRTVQVKLRTDQGGGALHDGMFVVAWIIVQEKQDAVLAPNAAWLYAKDKPYVFVLDPDTGTVERRDIVEGIDGVPYTEILSGVSPGELLVTKGRNLLTHGAPVRVVQHGEQ